MHLPNLPTNSSRRNWKVDVWSIKGTSKDPSHKNIKFVTIACYHFNGKTQHMLKFGQSFKRVLKQPMISIEFWGNFTKCSTTDCWKTPLDTSLTRHQTDLSKPCKLTCASLIMSKKAMPCCILRKRACGSSKDIFGKQVFCSTQKTQKKTGHHVTAHREGIF